MAWEPEILLEELDMGWTKKDWRKDTEKALPVRLQKDEEIACVYDNLTYDSKNLSEIIGETSLTLQAVSRALIQLCLAGCADGDPGSGYFRT